MTSDRNVLAKKNKSVLQ